MFGIGLPELILILVIALIVIGPSKLPELARALGKGLSEFRKATQEIKDSLDLDDELQDVQDDLVDSISGIKRHVDMGEPESKEKITPGKEEVYERKESEDKDDSSSDSPIDPEKER